MSPARTERQRKFMAAEFERAKEGKPTRTDMTQKQRHDFMSKVKRKGKGK